MEWLRIDKGLLKDESHPVKSGYVIVESVESTMQIYKNFKK